jgi:alanine racemase
MTLPHPALADTPSALATPLPRVLRPQRAAPADTVRPTRAEVNLASLRHNLRVLQRAAKGAAVWGVLKADGYGHGAKAIARTLERAGASGICVALLEEGIELRAAGIQAPILVMGGHYGRAWGEILRHQLTPVVHDVGQVEAIAEEIRYTGSEPIDVHLKVDTGMARLGAQPKDLAKVGEAIRRRPEVRLSGLMTHLACADAGDDASVGEQLALFEAATETLRGLGLAPRLRHVANSAALLRYPRARFDLVRPGIGLFGVSPDTVIGSQLRPVMRVRSEVVAVRELAPGQPVGYGATWRATRPSRIATIPMGYADGLSRALSNRGQMLIRGCRAPIVGVVSMDMTMIDVTDIQGACVGDECVVLGQQRGPLGEDEISAQEIADGLGTIAWEVLTAVSRRVPRFYREP